jgi:hypothetical protein
MRHFPGGLSLPLLLNLVALPALASAEDAPQDTSSLKVALDLGGTLGAMHHPFSALPATPLGLSRSAPQRNAAGRVTFGVAFALSQFLDVENLWESNALDWYLSGNLRVFSLRVGLEKELPLSRRFALGLAAHGAAAEASIGTGETSFNAPPIPDTGPGPDAVAELRADQWLFGLGGTASLLVLTGGPVYFRFHAGYTQYFDKAHHFRTQGKDYTPEGFSVSLSGPSGGLAMGVRL